MLKAPEVAAGQRASRNLAGTDPVIAAAVAGETRRQRKQLELIATKNYLSRAVYEAHSSILALTSVEGYPGRRMHAGMEHLDVIERTAVDRAKRMFGCGYANVQPHSGTQANQAAFFALLEPGDRVLSLALKAGGHLSHGLASNISGRWFDITQYGLDPATGLIDYDEAERLALQVRPRLIITGGSSYPRVIDYKRLRAIADLVGATLMADVAHISGQIVGKAHPNPLPHAHIVTSTTNKNLRGCRGGLLLSDDDDLFRRLDSAVFPGMQGGPLPELICAKAVSFKEALEPEFRSYAARVLGNARALAGTLAARGYEILTGGTDTPLVIVDLRPRGITGDVAQRSLEAAGITSNRNLLPDDETGPFVTSGLRFGTSAITTRGMTSADTAQLADVIADVLDGLGRGGTDNGPAEQAAAGSVDEMSARFPIFVPSAPTGFDG